jgi:hypothetical protein
MYRDDMSASLLRRSLSRASRETMSPEEVIHVRTANLYAIQILLMKIIYANYAYYVDYF